MSESSLEDMADTKHAQSTGTSRPTSTGGQKRQGGSPRGVKAIAKLAGGSKTIRSLDDTYQIGFPGITRIDSCPARNSNCCKEHRASERSRRDRTLRGRQPVNRVQIPSGSRRMGERTYFRSRVAETVLGRSVVTW